MIEQLTRNLEEMIFHQRLAELYPAGSQLQEDHHAEALRYRLKAHKLDRQIRTTRLFLAEWVREN